MNKVNIFRGSGALSDGEVKRIQDDLQCNESSKNICKATRRIRREERGAEETLQLLLNKPYVYGAVQRLKGHKQPVATAGRGL